MVFCRVLLFHVAAILDPNMCELLCLQSSNDDRAEYFSSLYHPAVRDVFNLIIETPNIAEKLSVDALKRIFGMFHKEI